MARAGLGLIVAEGIAGDLVKAGAIVLAVLLLVLLLRATGGGAGEAADVAGMAARCVFAFVFAWLVAWLYVLPWYDGLGWALLALLPISAPPVLVRPVLVRPVLVRRRAGPAAVRRLDWLLLARTAALAFGYLPARGITMPADLGWLRSVVRTGVTPVILLTVTVWLVVFLWRLRPGVADPESGECDIASGQNRCNGTFDQPDP